MARVRVSTTVDSELLAHARAATGSRTDAELIDDALTALLARYRAAALESAYAEAYDTHPMSEPDEWGSLDEFRRAAAS